MRYNATGMVMHDDKRSRCRDYGRPEHLPGMDKQRVQRSHRNENMPFDAPPSVQQQRNKAFHLGVKGRMLDDMLPPIVGSPLRRVTQLHLLWQRTVPERDNLV